MFRCFVMRKKIYDYVDNSLGENEKVKVANHLESCAGCRQKAEDIRAIISAVRAGPVPQLSEDFWHGFQAELDYKLNRRVVPTLEERRAVSRRLRPVFAFTMVSLLILFFSVGLFYRSKPLPMLAIEDATLIEEINTLEEVSQEQFLEDEPALVQPGDDLS